MTWRKASCIYLNYLNCISSDWQTLKLTKCFRMCGSCDRCCKTSSWCHDLYVMALDTGCPFFPICHMKLKTIGVVRNTWYLVATSFSRKRWQNFLTRLIGPLDSTLVITGYEKGVKLLIDWLMRYALSICILRGVSVVFACSPVIQLILEKFLIVYGLSNSLLGNSMTGPIYRAHATQFLVNSLTTRSPSTYRRLGGNGDAWLSGKLG